jgi:short-subunit dehydrogenase
MIHDHRLSGALMAAPRATAPNVPRTPRPTALVTGASGGIGEALARLLAMNGHDLVLVARREKALQSLAVELEGVHGARSLVVPADLVDPAAPRAIAQKVEAAGRTIDVLVNNAGYAVHGPIAENAERAELDMLQVNVMALVHLTKLFLPAMVERGRGRVLNVASTAAFAPGPFMAGYYASKAFVLSWSEGLAAEAAASGVTVTALCPGPTETGFATTAGVQKTRLFRKDAVMDAASVARAGFRGLMSGARVVVPGMRNKVLVASGRFAPRRLSSAVTGYLNEG